jgi:hypothetical protein
MMCFCLTCHRVKLSVNMETIDLCSDCYLGRAQFAGRRRDVARHEAAAVKKIAMRAARITAREEEA